MKKKSLYLDRKIGENRSMIGNSDFTYLAITVALNVFRFEQNAVSPSWFPLFSRGVVIGTLFVVFISWIEDDLVFGELRNY